VSVHLVGAGPGDPGLITVRGLELVRACDALVYDRLVAPELVAESPVDALRIPRAELTQRQINGLLVDLGRRGLDVVRLKGGDPYVFGRGGEEALALARAGVPFDVVPGVPSIAAVPAAVGIPVTHRGVADTVTIATGHDADGGEPDYEALARIGGTLLFFMALERASRVAAGLLRAGLDPRTPTAVVSRGTLPDQRSVTATLSELEADPPSLPGPALLVVGHTVRIATALTDARPCRAGAAGVPVDAV
jgi:uroporphyrin-III C-methyltransferase